jgi:hypothetical protein
MHDKAKTTLRGELGPSFRQAELDEATDGYDRSRSHLGRKKVST